MRMTLAIYARAASAQLECRMRRRGDRFGPGEGRSKAEISFDASRFLR